MVDAEIMNKALPALRKSIRLKRDDWELVAVVFVWLLASSFFLKDFSLADLSQDSVYTVRLLVFLLLDTYLTVCVYASVKDLVSKGTWERKEFWKKGAYFFSRVLAFKFLVALSVFILVSFLYDLGSSLQVQSPLVLGLLFAFFLIWVSIPLFFIALSCLAPLFIVTEDLRVFPAMARSVRFVRENLAEVIILASVFSLVWLLAYFSGRLYNVPQKFNLLEQFGKSFILGLLEIITVRTFFVFLADSHERSI